MNIIQIPNKNISINTTLIELLKQAGRGNKETAFIGQIGTDETINLYLITYDTIVKLNDPYKTWNSPNCPVYVKQFVDLEIKAIKKGAIP